MTTQLTFGGKCTFKFQQFYVSIISEGMTKSESCFTCLSRKIIKTEMSKITVLWHHKIELFTKKYFTYAAV